MEETCHPRVIFLLSDYLASECEGMAASAVSLFCAKGIDTVRFGQIRSLERLDEIFALASEREGIVVSCFLKESMRSRAETLGKAFGLPCCDLFSPLLDRLGILLERSPLESPEILHPLDRDYFRRVRAVEYTIAADDGGNPSILKDADVVLVGVSRTCKTPLCMYLAQRGIMAANVPLVPGLDPPPELFEIPPSRIIGLTISPSFLVEIRSRRMAMMGLAPADTAYVSRVEILKEIEYSSCIIRSLCAAEVDVSGRALEETAQEILNLIGHDMR